MTRKSRPALLALALVAATLIAAGPATTPSAPALGEVGCWSFDQPTDARALDSSGKGNHGTLVGDAVKAEGKIGLAVHLDGEGDYVRIGPIGMSPTYSPYSFSFWGKLDAPPRKHRDYPFTQALSNLIWLRTTGDWNVLWLYPDGDFGYGDPQTDPAEWERWDVNRWTDTAEFHHVVVVSPGDGSAEIFFDGESLGLKTTSLTTAFPLDDVRVGFATIPPHFFRGRVDEIRIFDRALSAKEVREFYDESR